MQIKKWLEKLGSILLPFLLKGCELMSIKQDRSAARTAADIERKYSFGRKFSEIIGLIDESREKVDSVESGLRDEIKKTETALSRDTEQIVMSAKAEVRKEFSESISGINGDLESMGESIDGMNNSITEISQKVELKVDANAVNIAIEKKMSDGVKQVETATGYRFDADGLNISKKGEEMSNLLDNTGMYVKRSGENILVANNKGVEAVNLHAKTYLIIGSGDGRSRIEDYGTNRTGVFWLG